LWRTPIASGGMIDAGALGRLQAVEAVFPAYVQAPA